MLEPLSGYILLAEKIFNNKLDKLESNWNFGPNVSSCKSVKYIANYFSKPLGLKVLIKKKEKNSFKPETSILRLSNHKAKKYLSWRPKWSLDESLDKIIEWNVISKKKNIIEICKNQILSFERKKN